MILNHFRRLAFLVLFLHPSLCSQQSPSSSKSSSLQGSPSSQGSSEFQSKSIVPNDIESNPCSVPSGLHTQKTLLAADIYCKKVLARYLRHPVSVPCPRGPCLVRAQCTPRINKHKCTVRVIRFRGRASSPRKELRDYVTDPTFWSYMSWRMDADVSKLVEEENFGSTLALAESTKMEEQSTYAAAYAVKGFRREMEDRFKIYENPAGIGASFFGVFDGHGGDFAAKYAQETFMSSLVNYVADLKIQIRRQRSTKCEPGAETSATTVCRMTFSDYERSQMYREPSGMINYEKLLTEMIRLADIDICKASLREGSNAGTTALIAIVDGSKLIVANVGDSRGVMCDSEGNAVPLSFDQKPTRRAVKERIVIIGGQITRDEIGRQVDGYPTMSRSLGNVEEKQKKHIITAPAPEVLVFDLSDYKPQFLVLATDGLYDILKSDQVVSFIKERLGEPYFGAKSLVHYALLMGADDNITVMVVKFDGHDWSSNRGGAKIRTLRKISCWINQRLV